MGVEAYLYDSELIILQDGLSHGWINMTPASDTRVYLWETGTCYWCRGEIRVDRRGTVFKHVFDHLYVRSRKFKSQIEVPEGLKDFVVMEV